MLDLLVKSAKETMRMHLYNNYCSVIYMYCNNTQQISYEGTKLTVRMYGMPNLLSQLLAVKTRNGRKAKLFHNTIKRVQTSTILRNAKT